MSTVKFKLSQDGLQIIRINREKKGWLHNLAVDDTCLIEASKHLEPQQLWDTREGYACGISEGNWKRFLSGKPLKEKIFRAFCAALDVDWRDVIDYDGLPSYVLLELETEPVNIEDATEFIRDVTIPDGQILYTGQEFVKIWEIRNSGNVEWKNRYFRRIGLHKGFGLIQSPLRVKIPNTKPGEIIQISVKMKAPDVEGNPIAQLKMVDSEDRLCFPDRYGHGLLAIICVVKP